MEWVVIKWDDIMDWWWWWCEFEQVKFFMTLVITLCTNWLRIDHSRHHLIDWSTWLLNKTSSQHKFINTITVIIIIIIAIIISIIIIIIITRSIILVVDISNSNNSLFVLTASVCWMPLNGLCIHSNICCLLWSSECSEAIFSYPCIIHSCCTKYRLNSPTNFSL